MSFFCPVCNKKLAENYAMTRSISTLDHGKPTNCQGIGQIGYFGHAEPKKQRQNRDRVNAVAANARHKQGKAVRNFVKYQTEHNDPSEQNARVERAKTYGLKGHASDTSNSKQNRGTTQGLQRINNG
jgi:hypothetical protein